MKINFPTAKFPSSYFLEELGRTVRGERARVCFFFSTRELFGRELLGGSYPHGGNVRVGTVRGKFTGHLVYSGTVVLNSLFP